MKNQTNRLPPQPQWRLDQWFSHLSLLWLIPLFCLVLLGAVWGAILLQISSEGLHARQEAIRQNENLVHAFEEHVLRTVRSVDQTVRFIKYEYERKNGKIDLASYLSKGVIQPELLVQLAIIGPDGMLRQSNLPGAKPINLSFREHFRVHVNHDSGQLFISKPVLGKVSGKWSIQFTRRLNRPDGSFGGVVVVSVDPLYFSGFYQSVAIGKHGAVTLVGRDGIVRARSNGIANNASIGADLRHGKLFDYWPRVDHASYELTSLLDGIPRFYSFRAVPGYPLAVVLGVSQQEALADFYYLHTVYQRWAIIASLLIAGFSYWMFRLALQLKHSQAKAESASKLKSDFLAHMSHELRTPLNGILGYAEYLRSTLQGEADREAAGVIQRSGMHLLSLVNTILDLARIEAGRMQLERQPEDVAELVRQVVETFRAAAEKKDLQLSLKIASLPDERTRYQVDRTKLVQIINNLVHNAVKFTERGSIQIDAAIEPGGLHLQVRDSGPGIAPTQQVHVFEHFRQAGNFLTRTHGGSGLGLALARELVRLMGGRIWFESKSGCGTTFYVSIPLEGYSDE